MTLGEDTVNLEVLYAFFHSECAKIPDFSEDYLSGAEGEARFKALLDAAVASVSEIYAMLAACRAVGIDPFSEEIDDAVTEQVKLTVEGAAVDGVIFPGYDSYDDYLEAIRKEYHMNDAVARLMIRYGICEERLIDYYENQSTYTDADVTAFFMSEDCIRVVWISRSASDGGFGNEFSAEDVRAFNLDLVTSAREYLLQGNDDKACQLTTSPNPKTYLGRHTLDRAYYAELVDTAYALPIGAVSDIMDLGSEGFHVIKRLEKSAADLDSVGVFNAVTSVYLYDLLMSDVLSRAATLLEGATYTDAYRALTPESFKE